jgi:hypothetical protein
MVVVHKKETEEFGSFVMMGLTRICTGVCIAQFLIMMISWFHTKPYAFGINFTMFFVSIAYSVYIGFRLKRVESLAFLKFKPQGKSIQEGVEGEEYDRAEGDGEDAEWYEWKEQERVRWIQLYTHPLLKLNRNVILSLKKVPAMQEYMAKIGPAVDQIFAADELELAQEQDQHCQGHAEEGGNKAILSGENN